MGGEFSDNLMAFYEKVDAQAREWNGFLGTADNPLVVDDWNKVYAINKHRLNHVHDAKTGRCMKNRAGVFCDK